MHILGFVLKVLTFYATDFIVGLDVYLALFSWANQRPGYPIWFLCGIHVKK